MNEAWYRVCGMAFGVFSAFAAALVLFLALRRNGQDAAAWKRVRRETPGIGSACAFRVVTAGGSRRLSEGDTLPVPYEGTLGSAPSCDVCIPFGGVHRRSAFFWMEADGLHMAPLHRDGFLVDGERAEPGDEAILRDGAELRLSSLRLRLSLPAEARQPGRAPYVTRERRARMARSEEKEKPVGREKKRAAKEESGRKGARKKAERRALSGASRGEADGAADAGKAPGAFPRLRVRNRDRADHGRL